MLMWIVTASQVHFWIKIILSIALKRLRIINYSDIFIIFGNYLLLSKSFISKSQTSRHQFAVTML